MRIKRSRPSVSGALYITVFEGKSFILNRYDVLIHPGGHGVVPDLVDIEMAEYHFFIFEGVVELCKRPSDFSHFNKVANRASSSLRSFNSHCSNSELIANTSASFYLNDSTIAIERQEWKGGVDGAHNYTYTCTHTHVYMCSAIKIRYYKKIYGGSHYKSTSIYWRIRFSTRKRGA